MNAMPIPAVTPDPAPAPMSQGSRIVNTFIAPSKTFTDLQRDASWWAPWLLIAVFSIIFVYSMGRNVGFDQIAKTELARSASQSEQFDKLPPGARSRICASALPLPNTSPMGYQWLR